MYLISLLLRGLKHVQMSEQKREPYWDTEIDKNSDHSFTVYGMLICFIMLHKKCRLSTVTANPLDHPSMYERVGGGGMEK